VILPWALASLIENLSGFTASGFPAFGFHPFVIVSTLSLLLMLGDYKVNRCTRQCHVQNRPLREGEWYYSVIVETDDEFVRRDYAAEAWTGPPEDAVGWWKKRMPKSSERKLVLAPPAVLIDLVRQMESFPEKAKSRYLLALMLMRKRLLKPADRLPSSMDRDQARVADDLPPVMTVQVISDGSTIDIPICEISRSESETLREQLNELLYCEASPESDFDADGEAKNADTEQAEESV
jgi:hypothetical protein